MKAWKSSAVSLIVAVVLMVASVSWGVVDANRVSGKNGVRMVQFTGNQAVTTAPIYGMLQRIVIAAPTGTETAWAVKVQDQDGATLFNKTDCNTVTTPYSYPITQAGTDGVCNYRGVVVAGPLTLTTSSIDYSTEVQTISITTPNFTPDAGYYTITYGDQTSGHIAYNATTSAIDTAIEAMSNIGTGNIQAVAGTALSTGNNLVLTGTGTNVKKDLLPFGINATALKVTGANEVQTIARAPTAAKGHYHITLATAAGTKVTAPIAWNAAKTDIDTALDATFGAAQIVSTATGGIAANDIVLTFSGSGYLKTDQPMVIVDNTALLASNDAVVAVTVAETTPGKADVTPACSIVETTPGGVSPISPYVVLYWSN